MANNKSDKFRIGFECFVHKSLQNKKKLSSSEIDKLFITMKKHNMKETKDDLLYKRVRKLVLFSRNEYKYNEYIKYLKKDYKDLTETELIECISIFVEYIPEVLNEGLLEELIVQYLSYDSDRLVLKEYLTKYKNNLKEYDYLIKLIDNNPNDILFNILILLESKDIDMELLEKLVNKMYVIDKKYNVKILNISLLKKVMIKLTDEELLYKVDNKKFFELKNKLLEKVYIYLTKEQTNKLVRVDMMNGKINIYPTFNIKKEDIYFEKLPLFTKEHVVAIDDIDSEDLDGAFSISKIDDLYYLNIYISDVPNYIVKQNELFNEEYNRGCSIYLINEDKTKKTIDMLPPVLSHKYLSLRGNYPKNVIRFEFIIDSKGNICNVDIDRVKTYINSNIITNQAQQYLDNRNIKNNDTYTLYLLKQLVNVLKKNTNYSMIKDINIKRIESLGSLPSLLVNYYVGSNSEFAIYRENGIYTKYNNDCYTSSSTPIRKFSSDINLMFFLKQKNIVSYPNKRLYWIKDNIDEVINHLNEREILSKFANSNSEFVKKYIKY